MAPRVLITFSGTRGDAQPYMVAGEALQAAGFEVMTAGNVDAAGLAESFKVPFRATRMSAREIMTNTLLVEAITEQSIPKIVKVQEQIMSKGRRREELEKWYQLLQDFKPQLVLCGGVSLNAVPPMAREMGIPALSFSLQRMRPSRYFTPFGFPTTQLGLLNLAYWNFLHWAILRGTRTKDGPAFQEFFKKPAKEVLMSMQEVYDLYACKAVYPSLIAESHALHGDFPEDFNENCIRIGAMMPAASKQVGREFGSTEVDAMEVFLSKGEAAPVFFGYGSMICKNSKFMTLLSLRALRLTGLRGIFCAAWSEMSLSLVEGEEDAKELKDFCKDHVLFVKYAPHGVLFPRCCAIVHHGGAGTTNASARSGIPTIILPLAFDQFDHADMVNKSGIGVGLKAMPSLTPGEIAQAICKCRETTAIRERAREVSLAMEKEDGPRELVDFVRSYMK
ncbi:ATG26, partial [Symbiodinium sp. CCMP2456]